MATQKTACADVFFNSSSAGKSESLMGGESDPPTSRFHPVASSAFMMERNKSLDQGSWKTSNSENMKVPGRFTAIALIAFAFVPCTSVLGVNIVTNGGFETGNFTGWTQSGNLGSTGVNSTAANSGSYGAYFHPVGSLGFISQNLVTEPGATYTLSFFLTDTLAVAPNNFIASFGGMTVFSLTNVNTAVLGTFTFNLVATSTVTPLQFGFRNDRAYWYIDDISVQRISGPGVPDSGSTLVILGIALVVIEGVRRKLAAS